MRIEHVSDGFVKVYRISLITGKENAMVLPTRQGEIEYWHETDALVQDVFPHFSADQREFLISGATPQEWEAEFYKPLMI